MLIIGAPTVRSDQTTSHRPSPHSLEAKAGFSRFPKTHAQPLKPLRLSLSQKSLVNIVFQNYPLAQMQYFGKIRFEEDQLIKNGLGVYVLLRMRGSNSKQRKIDRRADLPSAPLPSS